MELEITSTKKFFSSLDISLCNDWLESCIQWYRDENPNTHYSLDTLHLKVYQQWLLLDLRDVEVAILPRFLPQQVKDILNGAFTLQILYIIDISRPKLWQIQQIRNRNMYNHTTADQDAPRSERVLMLMLTDGVTKIEAIEYKPIKSLNINLSPGAKIKITGPVTIRKGQLFLEQQNVKVLGGEVEELLVCNASENVLARALGLPENPNPNTLEEEAPENNTRDSQAQVIPAVGRPANRNTIQTTITTFAQVNQPQVSKPTSLVINDSRVVQVNAVNSRNEDKDDEERIRSEIAMMIEAETDILQRIDESKPKETPVVEENFLEIEESIFEEMDIDAHLDMLDEQIQNQPKLINKITIADLKKRTFLSNDKVLIHARFKKVAEKLTATDNRWVLKLLVEDNSGEFEVKVHNDVITKLMGYTASAIMAFKKEIVNKNQTAKSTVLKAIEDLKITLMQLNCLMEITFSSQDGSPSITELKQ